LAAREDYFIQSVERAFAVLLAVGRQPGPATLASLEQATGLNKATVRRFLLTLADLGYVDRLPHNRFRMTPKVLDLAGGFLESLNLPDIAQPVLEHVSHEIGESSNMAVLDGSEVVYVVRVNAAERLLATNLRVGSRLPYYATSLGKALVAWRPAEERHSIWANANVRAFTSRTITREPVMERQLANCREKGYAVADGELEIGLRSLAVPIRNWSGQVVAAINISTHSLRTPLSTLTGAYLDVLRAAAQQISTQVGAGPLRMAGGNGPS
jgi:IclR family pca regulon transcriptional regulator